MATVPTVVMEMPTSTDPDDPKVQWWALCLLELGSNGSYDDLMYWLDVAKNAGCLSSIRMAAERITRARTPKKIRPLRKASGAFKALKVA